jgi:uncharacterized protein (DUF2267 family)
MSDTGYSTLSTSIAKTNELLTQIEAAYGWDSAHRELSYHALRAVLHALRDRLTVAEAADMAAQLPLVVRGLFYEGWSPHQVPIKMNQDVFLERVAQEFTYDLSGTYEELVQIVMVALSAHVTPGEMDDIKTTLPKDIAGLLP